MPSADDLRAQAVQCIVQAAAQAIAARGAFHLVLAGGTTPRAIYEALRTLPEQWNAWHLYLGDERCLPPDHPERNSFMARQAWLAHVAIPAAQIHPIPAEQGADSAAAAYADTLHGVGDFDLVLLGLGEDGHTASLFPDHAWGTEADAPTTLAVHDAPKPPPARVSMSTRRLSQARQVLFVVSGASKREAVARWRAGESIPARSIAPASGVDVLVETAAY